MKEFISHFFSKFKLESYKQVQNYLPFEIYHLSMYESSSEMVMHSHLMLPKKVNMTSLIRYLHEQHIELDSIERNYLDNFYQERILKLNVSNVCTQQIDNGIKAIALALTNAKNYFV